MVESKTARVRFIGPRVEALLDDGLITVNDEMIVVKEHEIRPCQGATIVEIPMAPQMYSAWLANLGYFIDSRGSTGANLIAKCLRRCAFFDQSLSGSQVVSPGDLRLILSAQPTYRARFKEEGHELAESRT